MFKKYQHIENDFNIKAVRGLLEGQVTIQPKLDGSNCQIWMEDGELKVSSRNNLLSYKFDNAGCYSYIMANKDKYLNFFENAGFDSKIKLCGEWLVPHTIKYKDDVYRKFYVFDGIALDSETDEGHANYIEYEHFYDDLRSMDIEAVPYIIMSAQEFIDCHQTIFNNTEFTSLFNYLLDESLEVASGEGLVVKNYSYKNPFGRSQWCKLINFDVFKNGYNKEPKVRVIRDKSKEEALINEFLNDHLLSKCYHTLTLNQEFEKKLIGEYIKSCQNEFIEDFIKDKNLEYDVRCGNNLIAQKALDYLRRKSDGTI